MKKKWSELSPEVRRRKLLRLAQTAAAVLVTLIMLFPLYWMLITSLKSQSEIITMVPSFWPREMMWENYVFAWTSVPFLRFIFNTVYVTLWQMLIQTIVGVLAAYGFARGRFP